MVDGPGLSMRRAAATVARESAALQGAEMTDWLKASAADLGRAIGAGQIDPVTLTETYLNAIAAHPARDDIYSAVTQERAMAEAEAAKTRAGACQTKTRASLPMPPRRGWSVWARPT